MPDPIEAFRAAERRLFTAHGLDVREQFFDLPAPKMRARVLLTGDDGPPTLHVHGGGACGALMAPLAAALPGRRHFLIDRPGFGLSERAPIDDGLRAHAVSFLTSTMDALELDQVDVVANSMGGLWSLWLALDRPARVRSLALLGAPAMVGGTSAPMPMRLLGKPVIGALMMKLEPPSPQQVRVLWRRMGHDPTSLAPSVLDVMEAVQRVPAYARSWRELLGAALTLGGSAPGVALPDDDLRRLRLPVAYVWGQGDPFGDASLGARVAALTPGARLTVAGQGHLPWLDDAAGAVRGIEHVLMPLRASAA